MVSDIFTASESHNHPPDAADSNAKQAINKVKQMASSSQATNHQIYCAVTETISPATTSRLPGEDAHAGKINSYTRGVQPTKRKKRYLEKDASLNHIVSTYCQLQCMRTAKLGILINFPPEKIIVH